MPIVMFLTNSDLMRPDQNSYISWVRCRASYHGFNYPVPQFVDSVAFLPCRNPALLSGTTDGRQI